MGFVINPFLFATGGSGAPTPTFQADGGLSELGVSNPLPAYPGGIQADDIAFIHAHIHDSTSNNSIQTPAGWNVVLNHNLDTLRVAHGLFWKRLDGTESGSVEVFPTNAANAGSDTFEAVMSVWRGCIASGTPYEDMDSNFVPGPADANMTGADCTTTGPNRRVVYFGGHSVDATVTPAVGWTEVYDYPAFNGNINAGLHCLAIEQASAGTLSGVTHTLSANRAWDVISLALIPA